MRRRRSFDDKKVIRDRISFYLETPLSPIANLLDKFLLGAEVKGDPDNLAKAISFVTMLLERLPEELDRRFYFDSYLIQSIMAPWQNNPYIHASDLIIPTYSNAWGYEPLLIPSLSSESYQRLEVIHIPADNTYGVPFLFAYPWLCHELAHYIICRNKKQVINLYQTAYNAEISKLRLRAIADQKAARKRTEGVITQISNYWVPSTTNDRPGWFREFVADIIALWVCGPSFLEAFQYEHDKEDIDPFHIEQNHPPIDIRAEALVLASAQIGWADYIDPIIQLREQWKVKLRGETRNLFVSSKRNDLLNGAVESAIEFCRAVNVQPLAASDINRIQIMLQQGESPDEGVELFVAAWLIFKKKGLDEYEKWESAIYDEISSEITP